MGILLKISCCSRNEKCDTNDCREHKRAVVARANEDDRALKQIGVARKTSITYNFKKF